MESLFYAEDEKGNRISVIYRPGEKDTTQLDLPIIEYPIAYKGKIAVGYADGYVREISVK